MNKQKLIEVTYGDLPLSCPRPEDTQWNSHPKVMLPIEETGVAKCPYCGTDYVLKDWDPSHNSHH
ncbi:zinc-finger domain-containing protein [Hydrogenovibrio sp. 3SP14C1]|uniref:zinc-finger domain-containing protein n=1 Tax=Hydrogenovibrio sp. 3SP14C1 TaxID=3038774 RepID=UPI00241611BB|nr:zinc-finger domain-containing protein [Hydrogenovibrio sp. 3SP14C1]MDG4811773.1 zinc-finger domain-containing protein [Hydrogenovibrio sp. 3SP14C1]